MTVSRSDRIGFVGLGNIGLPMAKALLRDGWAVTVYDIRDDARQACAEDGAQVASSLEDLDGCTVLALAVSDDDAVTEVLEGSGLLSRLAEGAVVVVHSTILPSTGQRLAKEAERHGVGVLDAPVSGGAARAESGTLTIMVGGSQDDLERARPVLETMASDIVHVGEAGAGAAVKLANQLAMFAGLAGTLEAMKLAAAFGVSEQSTLEAMSTSTADSWVTRNWGFFEQLVRDYDEASVEVRFRPWSKDLWDVVAAARVAGLRLPVAGLIAQLVPDLVEGLAHDDPDDS